MISETPSLGYQVKMVIRNYSLFWLEVEIIIQPKRPVFLSCNPEAILCFEKIQLRICK